MLQNDRKSPGYDGLTANIIKSVHQTAPDVLTKLFNLCLTYGCFPRIFKKSVVRAVPKPSATDTTLAKSWRPISLLPVIGKVFEKLFIERIMHHLRTHNHLSPRQYGFTPGRSTADAVVKVVDRMRQIKEVGKVGAVVSLDVSGAFDHSWWPSILLRLKALNTPHNLWHLVESYFTERSAEFEIGGYTAGKKVTRGCPQGSACGPGLWIILYDEVLGKNLPSDSELVSFADDLVLTSWADDNTQLERQVNTAVDMIYGWGQSVKLNFNEAKTQVVYFTRRRNHHFPDFRMNGVPLQIVDSFRYLGLIVDNKLNWRLHLLAVQRKISKLTAKLASIARNTWGLTSEVTGHLYHSVIEPVLLYGIEAWGPALKYKWAQKLLTQMQRGPSLRICKAYCSVSADALPVIANILPLPIKAAMMYRLKSVKSNYEFEQNGTFLPVQRRIIPQRHPSINFHRFTKLSKCTDSPDTSVGSVVFTDGSKCNDNIGCAFVAYYRGEEVHYEQYQLPHHCSVFQSELLAIKFAIIYLKATSQTSAQIYTDSYSSLQAIHDRANTTPLVCEIQQLLLSTEEAGMQIAISWVKAHVGIQGNERADQLAKDCFDVSAPLIQVEAPVSYVKRILMSKANEEWNQRWTSSEKGKWTREIFPTVSSRKGSGHIELNFILTQFLTGHGKFNAYLHSRKCRRSPECECGEALQNSKHLLFDCPLTDDIRRELTADCYGRKISFTTSNIATILANHQLKRYFNEAISKIHRRLVLWESQLT